MPDTHISSLRELITAARQQHAKGAGAVLDILLRQHPKDAQELRQRLLDEAGVATFTADDLLDVHTGLLDFDTCIRLRCIPVRNESGQVFLGMEDPWNDKLLAQASQAMATQLAPAALTSEAMQRSFQGIDLPSLIDQDKRTQSGSSVDGLHAVGPIVSFVDTAIRAGYVANASDIHFECDRSGVTVKHRLDGVMTHFARMEGSTSAQETISRIKVMAQLDITEQRLPQDGRFRFHEQEQSIDLRVSIMPSVFGEDAVLRLLDKAQLRTRDDQVSLDVLGFDSRNAQLIRDLAHEPSGMLLVTGPTGSGKTTTVYAVLSEINTGIEKIITIEDPVEYELPGVLQIPVNERKGLTFAKGLRSILRHDPDRILVGEIRDAETAEIAVQSALTGHLVFTTVHANGVADIMGRFRHFGLDMFGFMSSLNGVVVQRLVRQLCTACTQERPATPREQQWFERHGVAAPAQVSVTGGCELCHGSGYKGRFVLAEVHAIDDGFRDHVTEGSPVSVLKQYAYARDGVKSLSHQAANHVLNRRTTLEEIRRVVGWL